MTSACPSVYIAGPDLFFEYYDKFQVEVEEICQRYGLRPVFPSEAPGKSSPEIFAGNIHKVRTSDAVVANVVAFRSPTEPDSGTAYEVGGAYIAGKPLAMWLPEDQNLPMPARIEKTVGMHLKNDKLVDSTWGALVEDFGSPVNLMLANSGRIYTNVQDALLDVAVKLQQMARGF